MESFIKATAAELLSGEGENIVYSPLNVYIALAMLAETTDGDTRKQLLNLLDASDIEVLRKRANTLWNANYNDDGLTSSILAREKTEQLFQIIERAENWLKNNSYNHIPILKWETDQWGEVPADFGRK